MKKIIPFTKDIPFQEGLKEILSISLDHDLSMKNQVLMGNFYLKGKYLTNSEIEDDFSYKIPFEINISDKYDINDTEFDIEDFYYDVIDNEKLRINIEVYIDGLIEKEEIIEEKVEPIKEVVAAKEEPKNVSLTEEDDDMIIPTFLRRRR